MARVGGPEREQAPVGRYHCRFCPVPGLPGRRRERWSFYAAERRSRRYGRFPDRAGGDWWSRGRRHPVLVVRSSFQVAKQRGGRQQTRRRDGKKGPGSGGRRKPCAFCRDKIDVVDYKDFGTLRRAMSEKGKIRSARITGACRRHQRQLAQAIKRARELGLLPYVADR